MFWQGSCVFTSNNLLLQILLIYHRKVRKCLILAKHSSNTVVDLASPPRHQHLWCFYYTDIVLPSTAICPDLIVSVNGVVNYSPATTPRLEGTTVTQSCLNGYVPSTTTRVCLTTRSWSGSALTYEGKYVQCVF